MCCSVDAAYSIDFVPSAPFNDRYLADIVLRSSDGIDFFAGKTILALSSPFFRDMISLPLPTISDETKDGMPVLRMSESTAKVLDALLCIIYPDDEHPGVHDVDTALGVLVTANKFEMKRPIYVAQRFLLSSDPASLNSKAAKLCLKARAHGLTHVAQHFALGWLQSPIDIDSASSPAFDDDISKQDIWYLFNYRKRVERAVSALLESDIQLNSDFFGRLTPLFVCTSGCGGFFSSGTSSRRFVGKSVVWDKLRAMIREVISDAPLASLDGKGLIKKASLQWQACGACRIHTASEDIRHEKLLILWQEMKRVASEVEFK